MARKPAAETDTAETETTTGAILTQTGPEGAATVAADAGGAIIADPRLDDGIDPTGRVTIIVQGPAAGRWRIGRHFTAEPTSIPARELTMGQLDALRADPLLMVSAVEAPY